MSRRTLLVLNLLLIDLGIMMVIDLGIIVMGLNWLDAQRHPTKASSVRVQEWQSVRGEELHLQQQHYRCLDGRISTHSDYCSDDDKR